MEIDINQLEVTILDGKCNVWTVSAHDVEVRNGDPECIKIMFGTQWEGGSLKSRSRYQVQVPILERTHDVCFAMIFDGLYPKVARVGLVPCENSDQFPNDTEIYWVKEYKNGKVPEENAK